MCDFFYAEIDHGNGCKTRDEALGKARECRDKYLASVVIVPLHVVVGAKKKARRKG